VFLARKHLKILFGQTHGFFGMSRQVACVVVTAVKGSFGYASFCCVLVTQSYLSCSPIPLSYRNMLPRAGSEREVISRSVMCSNRVDRAINVFCGRSALLNRSNLNLCLYTPPAFTFKPHCILPCLRNSLV